MTKKKTHQLESLLGFDPNGIEEGSDNQGLD